MNRYRNWILGVVAFSMLVGSLLLSSPRSGQAQQTNKKTQDVLVVNSSTEPVPTVATGTTTIAGNVAVTNTPTINLAPGTKVGIDPAANDVQIATTPANPIWVRDVDSARQPFQTGAVVTVPAGQLLGLSIVTTVPAGKRLVIEYVSASLSLPPGERWAEVVLQSPPGTYSHFLTPTLLGSNGTVDIFSISQQLRLYANPGQHVLVGASRTGVSAPANVTLSISGYLVDVP